jgi:hypothetical protein
MMGPSAVAVSLGLAAAIGACGSGPKAPVPPQTRATAAPSPTLATPTTFGGLPGKASKQACLADADTVQQASDTYRVLHGQPAVSIDALVRDGVLRTAPSTTHGYVIGYQPATGEVTAAGVCTIP